MINLLVKQRFFVLVIYLLSLTAERHVAIAMEHEQSVATVSSTFKIVVSIEPLYEIVSSLSHGINKPQVVYLNFNALAQPLDQQQQEMITYADIIIRVGKGFEPVLDEYIEQKGTELSNKTITLANFIPLLGKFPDKDSGHDILFTDRQANSDLRFWMDPRLLKMLVAYLGPQLARLDPDYLEGYLENEIALKAQLKKVESKIVAFFRQLSYEQKQMLAQFNPYLKNRYLSFANMQQMSRNSSHQSAAVSLCLQQSSFSAIPLNLEYTEHALMSLVHIMESCSKSELGIH